MIVLGFHGGLTNRQHEVSVTLAVNGRIVAICEEERYLRIKSCYGYLPYYSIQAALKIANIQWSDINLIVSPGETYHDFPTHLKRYLSHVFGSCPPIECIHHQLAHTAAAFYSSGLNESLVLSLDASGDGDCAMLAYANQKTGIEVIEKIPNQQSLGAFYTMMTYYLGFGDGDEYKVMGLAPYGNPNIDLSSIISPTNEGWHLDQSFFSSDPHPMSPFQPTYSDKLTKLLGKSHRLISDPVNQFHKDLASSTQAAFEACLSSIVDKLAKAYPDVRNLCYAGGVALNCKANKNLLYSDRWDNVFIPPAPSDRGLSLGCAYYGAVELGDKPWQLQEAYKGSGYSDEVILKELEANGIQYKRVSDVTSYAAELLDQNKIIGWYQGRSEAGARALGNRSILANCASAEMRDIVNARIKYREEFRPFAPACLFDRAEEYFVTQNQDLPWMCFAVDVIPEKSQDIAAVVHEDLSARLQTVKSSDNALFYQLLKDYESQSGSPVLMNTSFNLKGQPIVETPRDAIMTFFGCGLDALFLHHFVIEAK